MPKRPLTDKFVASAKTRAGEVQTNYFDAGFPALALRVGRREKTWMLFRRVEGKLKPTKLGRYPEVTLAEAREKWRQNRLGQLFGGAAEPSATVDGVIAEWLRAWRHGKAANTIRSTEGCINRVILPAWAGRNIADVTKRDVLALLDTHRDKPIAARHLFSDLRQFCTWLLQREIITIDPMAGLQRKSVGAASARDRVLSDEELGKLLAWCRGSNAYDPHRASAMLLVLTGARSDMIASLRWEEVNCDTISFGGERMKTGIPFELPITTQMRAVLHGIPRTSSPRVFQRETLNDKAKLKVDAATGLTNWQWRDIRRTVSTGMQRLGVSPEVIDSVQSHAPTGIKRVYQRHHYAAEKRQAFELWGAHLVGLTGST